MKLIDAIKECPMMGKHLIFNSDHCYWVNSTLRGAIYIEDGYINEKGLAPYCRYLRDCLSEGWELLAPCSDYPELFVKNEGNVLVNLRFGLIPICKGGKMLLLGRIHSLDDKKLFEDVMKDSFLFIPSKVSKTVGEISGEPSNK